MVNYKWVPNYVVDMKATVHYKDGESTEFTVRDSLETVNDIAYIDGVMQTNVEDVEVSA